MSLDSPSLVAERLARIHALQDKCISAPSRHDTLEVLMATVLSAKIAVTQSRASVWLLVINPPSSGKTTLVMTLKGIPARTVFLDTLTPESFASGAVEQRTGIRARPLLPELDGKCVVFKDMTTLLSQDERKVKKTLGDLQSIYDGEFSKGIGTAFRERPILEYRSRFGIIGCATADAIARHQRYLAQIGTRFLVYRMARLSEEDRARGFDLVRQSDEKLQTELQNLVRDHIEELYEQLPVVTIPRTHDASLRDWAKFVRLGRTPVRWERVFGEWGSKYELIVGEPEEPFRIYSQLLTMLEALTVVSGRAESTAHQLAIVRQIALSSIVADRFEVVDALRREPVKDKIDGAETSGLTAEACARAIRLSEDQARSRLDELVKIDLFSKLAGVTSGEKGRPANFYQPVPQFVSLILSSDFPDKTPSPSADVVRKCEELHDVTMECEGFRGKLSQRTVDV